MKYLKSVTVYYWSANHIALNVSQGEHTYEDGTFSPELDEDENIVRSEKFRALTHNSDDEPRCTLNYTPAVLKDLINTWFENKKKKIPSIIEDFWEDCALYIREDQVNLLKSLYQIMLDHQVFDDDEDLEEGYDEEDEDALELLKRLGVPPGSEKRANSLASAEIHEGLESLIKNLRENKTALENKYILLDFVEKLKTKKGLGIDVDVTDEDLMYGKLPLKEWVLPLGNSLTLNGDEDDYLEQLNLFGLNAKGIDSGIKKFDDPSSIVHHGVKETYYKFFSRYHNCSGYSRYLLEQGGITAFGSTNQLEKYGVTDPSLYDAYLAKVSTRITELNEKYRDLMRNANIRPKPLDSVDSNYLSGFKKGEPIFEKLPRAVRNAIDEYNKEITDVSYEYKIQLLASIVENLHSKEVKQPEVIDALQKEVRRNYEINFDAQFSHNNAFQLKCLSALAAISIGALAVGLIGIVFPPILPITLAAAIVITVVAAATLAVAVGLFAYKSRPQRPSTEIKLAETLEQSTVDKDEVEEVLTEDDGFTSSLGNASLS